jgi:hypothetical protein
LSTVPPEPVPNGEPESGYHEPGKEASDPQSDTMIRRMPNRQGNEAHKNDTPAIANGLQPKAPDERSENGQDSNDNPI